jgi:hypothetical protein
MEPSKSSTSGPGAQKPKSETTGQSTNQKSDTSKSPTTGQAAPSSSTQAPKPAQSTQSPSTTQSGQAPASTTQAPASGSTTTTQQGQTGSQTGASVSLTPQQRTEIRSSVLASAPKVSDVNFSISVGTVVPRTVRIVEVPPTLVRIYPQWRGHMYFVVGDQIIIVERNSHRIVAVITV